METNLLLALGVWMTNCFESCLWDMQDVVPLHPATKWAGITNCCLHVIQLSAERKGPAKQNTGKGKHIYPAHMTNTLTACYWSP